MGREKRSKFANDAKSTADLASQLAQKTSLANTIVLFGDSLTEYNGLNNYESRGYFTWANIFLKQRFNLIKNAGIAGNRTSHLLTRIDADVIAYSPKYCFMMIGINDIGGGVDAPTIIENLKSLYSKLKTAGITLITSTISPSSAFTAPQKAVWSTVNNWIKLNAQNDDNIILVDFQSKLTTVTGVPIAGTVMDTLHFSPVGAYLCGTELFNTLDKIVKPINHLSSFNGDSSVLNPNACMVGNTAGLADNFYIFGGTKTLSKVARTDGIAGEWQKISSTVEDEVRLQSHDIGSGFAVGDTVYALCEIEVDNITSIKSMYLQASAWSETPSGLGSKSTLDHGFTPTAYINKGNWKGVLRTPDLLLPAGTVNLRMVFGFTGIADVRIGRMEIKKSITL